MPSSRWCPTPEQIMILEEMYRSGGIRTPNATQIQQITAHLSLYGKIEGKNVFYWFQNHKARDRQRLRRKLVSQQLLRRHHRHHLLHYLESPPPPPALPLPLPQLSHYTSFEFLPQVGVLENASTETVSYNVEHLPAERLEIDKSMVRTYGRDWMMMVDVGPSDSSTTPPTPACCNNKPLKTLELFPITATGLNEKCNTTSIPMVHMIPSSMSPNLP